MKTLTKLVVSFMIIGSSSQALAGFHLDPYVGYILSGSLDTTTKPPNTTTSDNIDGLQFGSRLGWGILGLTFGLDYQFGTVDVTGGDADVTNLGAFVGYELPVLVRAWLTYTFDGDVETSGTSLSGEGFKLGVGYTGFPMLSINIEHGIYNYSGTINSANVETDMDATMISVSIPFTL